MITRTTIGADFEGALSYGAGIDQRGAAKKAELIGSSNLGDVSNPRGLGAEMQSVADERSKCKNPVWHTSLSWAKGEHLSTEQKLKAATLYCELLRAQLSKKLPEDERAAYNVWEQHQVAVYEHHDKEHEHIHIYINRVPLDGGAAIETGRNYKFNLKAIQAITQELGLNPLPAQRQSINDSRPPVQEARQEVRAALVEALADPQVQSIEQLQAHLAAQDIEMRTKRSQVGQLVGVSFKKGAAAVTGQEVGMKAARLREHYEPAQRQGQDQVQQLVAGPLAAAEVASSPAVPVEVLAPLVAQEPPVAARRPGFTLAELPQDQLSRFGLDVAKLQAQGQLQKLLNGGKTDLLTMQGGLQRDKALVSFEGKLQLQRAPDNSVTLSVELPMHKLTIPNEIGGQPVTPEQRQRLETEGSAGLMRGLKDAQGNTYNGYVGVDKVMNKIAILPENKVSLTEGFMVAGVRLSPAQLHDLKEGHLVHLSNVRRSNGGQPFDGTVQIHPAKASFEIVPQKALKGPRQSPTPLQPAAEPAAALAPPPVSEPRPVAPPLPAPQLKPEPPEEEEAPKQQRKRGIRR